MPNKKKMCCYFWRWLILSIIRFPKLYALVWGILILLSIVFLKTDFLRFLQKVV